MADKENLVGKRVNLHLLTNELEKNNHKIKVCDFLDAYYLTMGDLEEHHPLVKEIVEKLGKDYDGFVCAIVFSLCMRLASMTLSKEAFIKMVDRITVEEIDLDIPQTDKGGMN